MSDTQADAWSADTLQVGGYNFATIIHEIGHSLGLAHPHDGGPEPDGQNFPGVMNSGSLGTHNQNQTVNTIMSYVRTGMGAHNSNPYDYGYQGGLGAFDIRALQVLYGEAANATGDTPYYLPQVNAGGNDTAWKAIWDSAGTDTIHNADPTTHVASNHDSVLDLRNAPLTGEHAGGYRSQAVFWEFPAGGVVGVRGGFTIAFDDQDNGDGFIPIIENAVGGNAADRFHGNSADNHFDGGDGIDWVLLDGVEADYDIINATTVHRHGGSEGTDTLANIEGVIFSNGHLRTFGGPVITTNNTDGGQDSLISSPGDIAMTISGDPLIALDSSLGTANIDRIFYAGGGSLTLPDNIENLAIIGRASTTVSGNALDNVLSVQEVQGFENAGVNFSGLGGNDTLIGSSGNDTLNGGANNDSIFGMDGTDTASYAGASAAVTVNLTLTDPQNTGGAGTDALLYIENLLGSSFADHLTGDDGNNVLTGAGGGDDLDGGAGNDVFRIGGSEGIGDAFDGGAGTDAVQVTGSGNATLAGFNASASHIEQWLGNGKGLLGTSAGNSFNFSALTTKAGLGFIDGAAGNDTIVGSGFADVLRGGAGRDTMTGNAGNDDFDFNSITETKKGGSRDRIMDFKRGQDDIDLSTIDATKGGSGHKFKWIGKDDFSDKKGELRYDDKGSSCIVQGDVNGDGKADFEIFVNVGSLGKGDFVL